MFVLFVSSSLFADGANQRATTLPIPRVVTRDLPISPRFTPTSFYRDAGSVLLHLVNQWLNFSYSRPHAFRYGNQKKNSLLLSLELTNSDLVGVSCTHKSMGAARIVSVNLCYTFGGSQTKFRHLLQLEWRHVFCHCSKMAQKFQG